MRQVYWCTEQLFASMYNQRMVSYWLILEECLALLGTLAMNKNTSFNRSVCCAIRHYDRVCHRITRTLVWLYVHRQRSWTFVSKWNGQWIVQHTIHCIRLLCELSPNNSNLIEKQNLQLIAKAENSENLSPVKYSINWQNHRFIRISETLCRFLLEYLSLYLIGRRKNAAYIISFM